MMTMDVKVEVNENAGLGILPLRRPEDSCFICLKREKDTSELRRLVKEPAVGSKLEESCHAMFLLSKVLELPGDKLREYLETCGNPNDWIGLCRECQPLVREALEVYQKVAKILGELRTCREKIVDKIRQTETEEEVNPKTKEEGVDVIRKARNYVTTRTYVSTNPFVDGDKLAEKLLPKEVTSCQRDVDDEYLNDDNFEDSSLPFDEDEDSEESLQDGDVEDPTNQVDDEEVKSQNVILTPFSLVKRKVYTCPSCPSLSGMHFDAFVQHVMFHQKNPQKCLKCSVHLPHDHKAVENHWKESPKCKKVQKLVQVELNVGNIWECSQCEESFSTEYARDAHEVEIHEMCRHGAKAPYSCKSCSSPFHSLEEWRLHRVISHPDFDELACIYCDKTFSFMTKDVDILDSNLIRKHLKARHSALPHTLYESCHICGQSFPQGSYGRELLEHLKEVHDLHLDRQSFVCPLCDLVIKAKDYFNFHVKTFHCEKKFGCEVCGFRGKTQLELKKHKKKHIKKRAGAEFGAIKTKVFTCSSCPSLNGMDFGRFICHLTFHYRQPNKCVKCSTFLPNHNDAVDRHWRELHPECAVPFPKEVPADFNIGNIWECVKCNDKFLSDDDRDLHETQVHQMYRNKIEGTFSCRTCSKNFHSVEEWRLHRAISHPDLEELACIYCDRSFSVQTKEGIDMPNNIQLRKHLNECHRSLPHLIFESCHLCGHVVPATKLGPEIATHLMEHHNIPKSQVFACIACEKKYSTRWQLMRHLRSYHCELNYPCNLCRWLARTQLDLDAHKVHEHDILPGQRIEFKCYFEGCSFSTETLVCMTTHTKTHVQKGTFLCQLCGQVFKTLRHVLAHKKSYDCPGNRLTKKLAVTTIKPKLPPVVQKNHSNKLKHLSENLTQKVSKASSENKKDSATDSDSQFVEESTVFPKRNLRQSSRLSGKKKVYKDCSDASNPPSDDDDVFDPIETDEEDFVDKPRDKKLKCKRISDGSEKTLKNKKDCRRAKKSEDVQMEVVGMYPFRIKRQSFSCYSCPDLKQMNFFAFNCHIRFHLKRPYKCTKCSAHLPKEDSAVERHWADFHPDTFAFPKCVVVDFDLGDMWECCKCAERFPSEEERNRHEDTIHETIRHDSDATHSCNACSKRFHNYEEWRLHRTIHHTEVDEFSCAFCDQLFTLRTKEGLDILLDSPSLRQHQREKHNSTKALYEACNFCGEVFPLFYLGVNLTQHGRTKHNLSEKQMFICELCTKGYFSRMQLSAHLMQSHSVSKYSNNDPGINGGDSSIISLSSSAKRRIRRKRRIEDELEENEDNSSNSKVKDTSCIPSFSVTKGKLFTCPTCPNLAGMSFRPFLTHLLFHLRLPYKCQKCSLHLPGSDEVVDQHWSKSHPNSEKIFPKYSVVPFDLGNVWECSKCEEAFSSSEERDSHELQVHQTSRNDVDALHPCKLCPHQFHSLEEWRLHRTLKHPDFEHLACSYCDQTFSFKIEEPEGEEIEDKVSKKRHMREVHRSLKQDAFDACDYCGEVISQTYLGQGLIAHAKEKHGHDGAKLFVCRICYNRFDNKEKMNIHTKLVHIHKKFVCEMCGGKWRTQFDLDCHKLSAHEIRSETCEVFKCTHDGCTFETHRKGKLVLHSKCHSDARPFMCRFCGKGFKWSSYLADHEKIHTNAETRPYKCELCGTSYAVYKCLYIHRRLVHDGRLFPSSAKKKAQRALGNTSEKKGKKK